MNTGILHFNNYQRYFNKKKKKTSVLLLWFDVSTYVHLYAVLMIQFSMCDVHIVISSINNVAWASTIDLVQSLFVTRTHV